MSTKRYRWSKNKEEPTGFEYRLSLDLVDSIEGDTDLLISFKIFNVPEITSCSTTKRAKEDGSIEIIQRKNISKVSTNRVYYTIDYIGEIIDESIEKSEKTYLTEREAEVLLLIEKGATIKQISTILGISDSTVRTHKENIRDKYEKAFEEKSKAENTLEILSDASVEVAEYLEVS